MEGLLMVLNKLFSWLSSVTDKIDSINILDMLTHNFSDSYSKVNSYVSSSVINDLTNSIIAIAIVMSLIYFSIDLFSKINSANFTLEVFIRSFSRLIIGYAVIANIPIIADTIVKFGDSLVTLLTAQTSGSIDFQLGKYKKIAEYLSKNDIQITSTQAINLAIKGISQTALAWTINITTLYVAYARAIRLVVYKIFLPLMVADFYGNGITGDPMKHIKKFLAIVLQYPICFVVGAFAVILIDAINISTGNWVAVIGQVCIITWAIFKVLKGSYNEATELFGGR